MVDVCLLLLIFCNFHSFLKGNPLVPHQAVPPEDVRWLHEFMKTEQITVVAALLIMRRTLFPFQHNPYGWVSKRPETENELMKSIMAIYLFRHEVGILKNAAADPADFSKYLYQPERDPETSELIHHREDHNHLLKRITNCLREGLIRRYALSSKSPP